MAFKKGEPRPPGAGRKAGTPNKAPPMATIRESLAKQGFDIGQELVKLYLSTKDDSIKLKALQTIATYSQVPPKDEPTDDDSLAQLSPEELNNLIHELESNPTGSPEDQAGEANPSLLAGGTTELEAPSSPEDHIRPDKEPAGL